MSGNAKFNRSVDPKKFNLRRENDSPLNIDPSTIPTLSPIEVLNEFGYEAEKDPYIKIQQIDYPIVANGFNYTESFFSSFTEKLNNRPFPGSKSGHDMSWGSRPKTDLLLIGARMNSNGDGTGSVFFKNWVPKKIGEKDNSDFIVENKAGLVDYSLVSWTEDEAIENEDGSVTWNVVRSIRGERNDAVEFGGGAMEQKTNSQRALDINKGENMSKKKETLETLAILKTNAEVTLPEIAKHLGLEHLLVTDAQKANSDNYEVVKKLCGEVAPEMFVKNIILEKKENAAEVRKAKFNDAFGPLVHDATKKENSARVYAEKICGDMELTDEKVNEIQDDSIYKRLAADWADVNSDQNLIGEEVKANAKTTSDVAEY